MLCTVVELMVLAPDGEDGKTERKEQAAKGIITAQ